MEKNKLKIAQPDYRRFHLRGSSGVVFAHFLPRSFGIKNKSRRQEGRGVTTPGCWFKHVFRCPRDARFVRSLPLKEAEKSVWDIIGQKIVEQGVLQALALE